MVNGKRVLIIIPAWNEAGLDRRRRRARSVGELPGVDVLVVDDGSTDDTAAQAAAPAPWSAGCRSTSASAVRCAPGYRYARDHGYDVAIQVDADGQHDPRYIPKLVDAARRRDLVIGARFAGEGDYAVAGPRRWAMAMLSPVLSRVAGTELTDTTSRLPGRQPARRSSCSPAGTRPSTSATPSRSWSRRPQRIPHQPDAGRDAPRMAGTRATPRSRR